MLIDFFDKNSRSGTKFMKMTVCHHSFTQPKEDVALPAAVATFRATHQPAVWMQQHRLPRDTFTATSLHEPRIPGFLGSDSTRKPDYGFPSAD
jgi:hypothetical protein